MERLIYRKVTLCELSKQILSYGMDIAFTVPPNDDNLDKCSNKSLVTRGALRTLLEEIADSLQTASVLAKRINKEDV